MWKDIKAIAREMLVHELFARNASYQWHGAQKELRARLQDCIARHAHAITCETKEEFRVGDMRIAVTIRIYNNTGTRMVYVCLVARDGVTWATLPASVWC